MSIIIPMSLSGERLANLEKHIKVTDNEILRDFIFSAVDEKLENLKNIEESNKAFREDTGNSNGAKHA